MSQLSSMDVVGVPSMDTHVSAYKVETIRRFPYYFPNTECQASSLTQALGLPKNQYSGTQLDLDPRLQLLGENDELCDLHRLQKLESFAPTCLSISA